MQDEQWAAGIAIREHMWGADGGQAKVDRASDFQRDLEELVTRYCFGTIWARDVLTQAERSMITLGMLVALGRSHEIGVHVVGAVNNGLSREQIGEILLHSAVYCGIPAAVSGFRTAEPVLDELESR